MLQPKLPCCRVRTVAKEVSRLQGRMVSSNEQGRAADNTMAAMRQARLRVEVPALVELDGLG